MTFWLIILRSYYTGLQFSVGVVNCAFKWQCQLFLFTLPRPLTSTGGLYFSNKRKNKAFQHCYFYLLVGVRTAILRPLSGLSIVNPSNTDFVLYSVFPQLQAYLLGLTLFKNLNETHRLSRIPAHPICTPPLPLLPHPLTPGPLSPFLFLFKRNKRTSCGYVRRHRGRQRPSTLKEA